MLFWFWGPQGVKYFMSYELPGNAVFRWVDFNNNLCEQNNLSCVFERSWHTSLPTSKMCDLRLDAVLISAMSMTFLTQESSNAMHTDFLSPKGCLLWLTNYRDLIYNKQIWSERCNKWWNASSGHMSALWVWIMALRGTRYWCHNWMTDWLTEWMHQHNAIFNTTQRLKMYSNSQTQW